jgi:hypothetical protein
MMPDYVSRDYPPLDREPRQWEMGLQISNAPWFDLHASDPRVLKEKQQTLADFPNDTAQLADAGIPLLRETLKLLRIANAAPTTDTMKLLACAWQPDMFLMNETVDADGQPDVALVGYTACQPTHWIPAQKFGLTSGAIHANAAQGEVNEQLQPQMRRFLLSAREGITWERRGWSIDTQTALDTNPAHRTYRFDADVPNDQWQLRVEKQGLRVLRPPAPDNRGVLFMVQVEYERLIDLKRTETRRVTLLDTLARMSPRARKYKGLDDRVLATLIRVLQ